MPNTVIQKKRLTAMLMLLLTAALWSLAGILIKYIDWNPMAINGVRSIIAVIVIYPLFIRKKKIVWSRPLIFGALAYAVTVMSFVTANKLTTAANAILLQYTSPLFVALFSIWLLKEKIRLLDWISIAFILGGMCLFFLDDLTPGNMAGNLLGILSGIAFAFLAIFLRMQKDASPVVSIFLGNVLTSLIGIPFMFKNVPGLNDWIALFILGLFQLTIPYILFSFAIKHVSALESMLIPMVEPLLNPIWVLIFLHERPGEWALAGGAIVLLSVVARGYIVYRRSSKERS
jgi:drug/metabolite transporter (DMT)-like permease